MRRIFGLMMAGMLVASSLFAQKTEVQYLSGKGSDDAVEWEFFCSDGQNSQRWTTIRVPSCWELQGFGQYQYGISFYGKPNPPGIANEEGQYKYKFKLPKEWEGRVIRIVFDGVMTDCSVNINGRTCIKAHQGGFYRFKADISDLVFFGDARENLLEATVRKESANPSVNLAERRADYWNFGGIFRPVFVEALPPQFIDRTAIDAKADGSFSAEVYLGAASEKEMTVSVNFLNDGGKPVGRALEAKLAKGSDRIHVQAQLSDVKLWTAETPLLYKVEFSLKEGGKTVHQVGERFGFRTVEVREGDGLYLNGQRIQIRGVNRHSFRPETGRTLSRKANYDDVRLMKAMNMNAVRLSHYPPDPDFLEACDELGLYVMDELGGWHGRYDTPVGTKLVREMVERDLNHPSIIWWSNGNEGGHNLELDPVFSAIDVQKRPVLHPQKNFGGFETMHYRSYGESLEYMRKPEIYLPTEFLHGLYDGGHGAGLWDYWEAMRSHPRCIGGFLWDLADEGVVRTDQNGRIDNVGNYGADGIVGPHHEREGSFYTVKQIWSPVQITTETLPDDFAGALAIDNRYDFIDLKDCRFAWTLKAFPDKKEKITGRGEAKISLPPHASGTLQLKLPTDWKGADALYVSAYDPAGDTLWTWSWHLKKEGDGGLFLSKKEKKAVSVLETEAGLEVSAGATAFVFSRRTGLLEKVLVNKKDVSFGNGPRFVAARRGDRSMDVYYNHDDKEARTKERVYNNIAGDDKLLSFVYQSYNDSVVVEASYAGDMKKARWTIGSDGTARLDYAYQFAGAVELMGVAFDYPEGKTLSKQWLGAGPYRVWQNRLHGTEFGIWSTDYNDPVPGETFTYPEFKGYFADWQWLALQTTEGGVMLGNGGGNPYIGVFTPRDGRDALLYTLPETGISFLKVIPAVRNKVNATDLVGPSSQAQWVRGEQTGRVFFQFK
jgi:beta-galactosidase/beta-glucuronidase